MNCPHCGKPIDNAVILQIDTVAGYNINAAAAALQPVFTIVVDPAAPVGEMLFAQSPDNTGCASTVVGRIVNLQVGGQ
jgi:hypothetical protein